MLKSFGTQGELKPVCRQTGSAPLQDNLALTSSHFLSSVFWRWHGLKSELKIQFDSAFLRSLTRACSRCSQFERRAECGYRPEVGRGLPVI
jgi:hypothetical protein